MIVSDELVENLTGFQIERVTEPCDDKTAADCPAVADTRHVALFLIVRCRKPR